MAEFLTTSGASHQIEQIILTAKNQIFLFSPYLKFSKTLFERLKDTSRRNIKITLVYGKSDLHPLEKQKLFSLENITLYFFENLHAKCYFNEKNMVITSMNIYEFSEKNNREMGMLLNQDRDLVAFTQACQEAASIIKNATKIENLPPEMPVAMGDGHCIRCLTQIKFNILKPLCLNCYRQWAKYKDERYIERYCHRCSCETKSCLAIPLCQACATVVS